MTDVTASGSAMNAPEPAGSVAPGPTAEPAERPPDDAGELTWRREQMEHNWPRNEFGSLLTKGEYDALVARVPVLQPEPSEPLPWRSAVGACDPSVYGTPLGKWLRDESEEFLKRVSGYPGVSLCMDLVDHLWTRRAALGAVDSVSLQPEPSEADPRCKKIATFERRCARDAGHNGEHGWGGPYVGPVDSVSRSPEPEWLAKLRRQFAEYKVPDGGVDNVPDNCVVVLRATVEKLIDLAGRSPELLERDCPHCQGQGWYAVPNRATGEPEQEQCEFCLATGKLYAGRSSLRAPTEHPSKEQP